jgi:hypothetical protein
MVIRRAILALTSYFKGKMNFQLNPEDLSQNIAKLINNFLKVFLKASSAKDDHADH